MDIGSSRTGTNLCIRFLFVPCRVVYKNSSLFELTDIFSCTFVFVAI